MAKKKSFSDEFNEALAAGGKRDYKKAVSILESLAARGFAEPSENKPGHPEIYLYLARSWHAEKKFAKAVSCARSYIRLRPEDGSGWFFLGRAFLADGAYDRAADSLRRSLDLKPDSVDARIMLGTALLKKGKPGVARKIFEEALFIQPENKRLLQGYLNALFVEAVRTYRKGDAELARQMLTFLIDNEVDGVAPRLYLGHALKALGDYQEALSQYNAARSFAPNDPSVSWYAISIYIDMGDIEKAAELMLSLGEANAANQISPQFVSLRIVKNFLDAAAWPKVIYAGRNYIKAYGEDSAVHSLMGEAQRNLGNLKHAANHFNLALKINPQDPAPYYGLMLSYSASRNWRALKNILPAAEACGCDPETIDLYSILCAANLNTDPEKLLPEIQEAVRHNGVMPCLLLALARTYYRLDLVDLASGWYKKILDMDAVTKLSPEEREEAMEGLFNSYSSLGDQEALLDAYQMCIERWDVPPAVRKEYIKLLSEKEMWEMAADQTELLLRYEDDASYSRQLAKYRRNAGQYRQAAVLYRNMLRSKPQDKNTLSNLVYCLDRMGERSSAVNLIHEANRIFSPSAESLLIESRLHVNAGKFDKALDVLRRVTDLFPDDVRGWEESASIYRKKNISNMAEIYEQKARDLRMLSSPEKKPPPSRTPKTGTRGGSGTRSGGSSGKAKSTAGKNPPAGKKTPAAKVEKSGRKRTGGT